MKNNRNKKTIYKTMLDGRHYTPGTVTMHKGQVISGSNGIAGLAGFKPFDVDVAEIPGM
ncbi:MAG: hypothetical protein J6C64_07470 [Lachnospiraceae bacterium]|nr:hypothetical protein [Lachnospiraceae bacterium]